MQSRTLVLKWCVFKVAWQSLRGRNTGGTDHMSITADADQSPTPSATGRCFHFLWNYQAKEEKQRGQAWKSAWNAHVMDISGSFRCWTKTQWFRSTSKNPPEFLTGVGGWVKRAASLGEARFICLNTFCSGAEGLQDWVLPIRNSFKAGWEGFWSEWAACVLLR